MSAIGVWLYRPASSRGKGSRRARESLHQGLGGNADSGIMPRLGMLLEEPRYDVSRLLYGYFLREAPPSAEDGAGPHGISNPRREARAETGLEGAVAGAFRPQSVAREEGSAFTLLAAPTPEGRPVPRRSQSPPRAACRASCCPRGDLEDGDVREADAIGLQRGADPLRGEALGPELADAADRGLLDRILDEAATVG